MLHTLAYGPQTRSRLVSPPPTKLLEPRASHTHHRIKSRLLAVASDPRQTRTRVSSKRSTRSRGSVLTMEVRPFPQTRCGHPRHTDNWGGCELSKEQVEGPWRRTTAAHGAREDENGQEWPRKWAMVGRGSRGRTQLARPLPPRVQTDRGKWVEGSRDRGATTHPRRRAIEAPMSPASPLLQPSSKSSINRVADLFL